VLLCPRVTAESGINEEKNNNKKQHTKRSLVPLIFSKTKTKRQQKNKQISYTPVIK